MTVWRDARVLVVDDDERGRDDIALLLRFVKQDCLTIPLSNLQSYLASLTPDTLPHLVLINAGDGNLAAALQGIFSLCPHAAVIVGGIGDNEGVGCLELNANQVVAKWQSTPQYNDLLNDLHRAQIYVERRAQSRNFDAKRAVPLFRSLVGNSESIREVRSLMSQVADKDVTVLITGESGTGKEVVARNLHIHSSRRQKPFVPVNCGAIPPDLLESELFGHEKGSFTGAISSRAGRFELAEGGTLFLDEIGDMPLAMQVKILRVLQERSYERVGGNKTYNADVRIIAATHKNLDEMIQSGEFREDLYYRLNVFPIEMPALRERVDDLPLLLNELIGKLDGKKQGAVRFNSSAIMSLCKHPWGGNVRELANLVERMTIMYPGEVIGLKQLPEKFRHIEVDEIVGDMAHLADMTSSDSLGAGTGFVRMDSTLLLPPDGIDLKAYVANLEQSLIQQALDDSGGVVARAAERLKMRRTTLVEKMRKYDMQRATQTA